MLNGAVKIILELFEHLQLLQPASQILPAPERKVRDLILGVPAGQSFEGSGFETNQTLVDVFDYFRTF